jgi:ssDNA-binding Zn-finger/Zn-ribbon topoisomerase 1
MTSEREVDLYHDDSREVENYMNCPQCGGELVKRIARKGPNAGKEFFGCRNYPKCRYIK